MKSRHRRTTIKISYVFLFFSTIQRSIRYESDRASNSGSGRYYRDQNYQQQQDYAENNYENNAGRRSTNYPTRNGQRPRRGGYNSTGNSYRGGTQSDAGTGGKKFMFKISLVRLSLFCSTLR